MKLYQDIALTLLAYRHCDAIGNTEARTVHKSRLKSLVERYAPSGSGFDSGTTLDIDASSDSRLVFRTSFHHMTEHGYYDGWTEHRISVGASFIGVDVKVSGRNRNDIKSHIAEIFSSLADTEVGGQ